MLSGVPIIRTRIFVGLDWGRPILGNHHTESRYLDYGIYYGVYVGSMYRIQGAGNEKPNQINSIRDPLYRFVVLPTRVGKSRFRVEGLVLGW